MAEEYNIGRIIKMLLVVVVTILIFYGITVLVTNAKNKKTSTNTDGSVEIQNKEILIGSMYDEPETEYYVLVQLSTDYSNMYTKVSAYQDANKIKLYTANLNSAYNKKYLGQTSNFDIKFPMFNQTTLLKISNGVITEHYEGVAAVLAKLTV